eukprot:gene9355-10158_t
MFNLFYFGHILLYIALIVPAFMHGATVLGLSVILWVLDEKISLHVRKSGDWTIQLYDMVKEKAKTTDPSGSGNMLWVEGEVAVEGPYGGIDRRRILSCIENPQYQLQVNCVGDRPVSIDLRYILPVHRLGIFSFTKIINFHLIGTYKLDLLEFKNLDKFSNIKVCKLFYCSLPPDDLSVFSSLQVFELTHCSTITDVSALAHIPNLTLHQCWNITNIDVLTHNNRLNINLCVNIEKISLSDHPRDEVKIGRLFKLLEVVGKVKKVLLYDIPILSQISLPNDVKELNILEAESLISLDNVPHTQFISLESCENFTEISPSLQVKMLEMKECGSIKSIKSLQFLEKLKLTSLENLRNIEDLPSLITLQVDNCDSLRKVTNLPLCKKYGKRFRR